MPAATESPQTAPMETGEGADGGARVVKRFRTTKRSFAETTAAAPTFEGEAEPFVSVESWFEEDLNWDLDGSVGEEPIDDGIPSVTFTKEERLQQVLPWKNALIIKFFGKALSLPLFKQRVSRMWELQGKMDLIDLGYGFYVARFTMARDCMHVLMDGPWKLFNHYLVAQRWQPNFKPATAKITKMAIWIGRPLKLDRTTSGVERGQFARASVEVDVTKPLVAKIRVNGEIQYVEYEGLHVICFSCGEFGHRDMACPLSTNPTMEETQNVDNMDQVTSPGINPRRQDVQKAAREKAPFGSWMLVERKKNLNHANKQKHRKQHQNGQTANTNRFSTLADANGERVVELRQKETRQDKNKATQAKGKQISTYPTPNVDSRTSLQGLDSLHDAPVFMEGEGQKAETSKAGRRQRKKKATETANQRVSGKVSGKSQEQNVIRNQDKGTKSPVFVFGDQRQSSNMELEPAPNNQVSQAVVMPGGSAAQSPHPPPLAQ
ncbi:PREDICTED: uncharacterized protein LOC109167863 [Ipomoea nil]|uniref:uncharacterized protein LOC109167863 n=1 Tax=Ipomoea nil TaxID=35883 RepID=UPI0009011538|nr:PREDICTED: uncharacterized protein LOC109167863 [Ipomoea nil]